MIVRKYGMTDGKQGLTESVRRRKRTFQIQRIQPDDLRLVTIGEVISPIERLAPGTNVAPKDRENS